MKVTASFTKKICFRFMKLRITFTYSCSIKHKKNKETLSLFVLKYSRCNHRCSQCFRETNSFFKKLTTSFKKLSCFFIMKLRISFRKICCSRNMKVTASFTKKICSHFMKLTTSKVSLSTTISIQSLSRSIWSFQQKMTKLNYVEAQKNG